MVENITIVLALLSSFSDSSSMAQSLNMCNAASQRQSDFTIISYDYHGTQPTSTAPEDMTSSQIHIESTSVQTTNSASTPIPNPSNDTIHDTIASSTTNEYGSYVRKKRASLSRIPRDSPTERTDCSCVFEAKTNLSFVVMKAWSVSPPEGAILTLRNKRTSNPIVRQEIKNYWNKSNEKPHQKEIDGTSPFSFQLNVDNKENTPDYSFLLAIEGTISNINCSGRPEGGRFTSNTEPVIIISTTDANAQVTGVGLRMLIGGIILAMIGLIMLVSGLICWRRYLPRKKQNQTPESVGMKSLSQDTYEEITADDMSHGYNSQPSKATIEHDLPSKSSMSKAKKHSRDSSVISTSSAHEKATTSAVQSKVKGFFKKGKSKDNSVKTKKKEEKKEERKEEKKEEEGVSESSTSQEDYEDINEDLPKSPINDKLKVATPFLLAGQKGASLDRLKKVDQGKIEDLNKAQSRPVEPLPSHDSSNYEDAKNDYMHLDRSGRAKSFDVKVLTSYEDVLMDKAGPVVRGSRTAEVCGQNRNKFNFASSSGLRVSEKISELTEDDEIQNTELVPHKDSGDSDGEDHIYEAYDVEKEKPKTESRRQGGLDSKVTDMNSSQHVVKASGNIPWSQVKATPSESSHLKEVAPNPVAKGDGNGSTGQKMAIEEAYYSAVDEEDGLKPLQVKEMNQKSAQTAKDDSVQKKIVNKDALYSSADETDALKPSSVREMNQDSKLAPDDGTGREKVVTDDVCYSCADDTDGLKSPTVKEMNQGSMLAPDDGTGREMVVTEGVCYSSADDTLDLKTLNVKEMNQDSVPAPDDGTGKGVGSKDVCYSLADETEGLKPAEVLIECGFGDKSKDFAKDTNEDEAINAQRRDQILSSSSGTSSNTNESAMKDGQDKNATVGTDVSRVRTKGEPEQKDREDLRASRTTVEAPNSTNNDSNIDGMTSQSLDIKATDLNVITLSTESEKPSSLSTLHNGPSQSDMPNEVTGEEMVVKNILYEPVEISRV